MNPLGRPKANILDRQLSKGKSEVSLSAFSLLFSEIVQYCHNRVYTVSELQHKLHDLGKHVGWHCIEILVLREKGYKRETKLLNILLFIKGSVWKTLFGKDADKLEHSTEDESTYYIIEKDPLVNMFISGSKETGSLNCAAFVAGIVEAILTGADFQAKVTAHWHHGNTLIMIKFDDSVVQRDRGLEGR